MIHNELASASSVVSPHAVMPCPPRMQPTDCGCASLIAAMSRPSWNPGRRHGTQATCHRRSSGSAPPRLPRSRSRSPSPGADGRHGRPPPTRAWPCRCSAPPHPSRAGSSRTPPPSRPPAPPRDTRSRAPAAGRGGGRQDRTPSGCRGPRRSPSPTTTRWPPRSPGRSRCPWRRCCPRRSWCSSGRTPAGWTDSTRSATVGFTAMIISSSRDQHVRIQLPHTSDGATVTTPSPPRLGWTRRCLGRGLRGGTRRRVSGGREAAWMGLAGARACECGWLPRTTPRDPAPTRPRRGTLRPPNPPAAHPPDHSRSSF